MSGKIESTLVSQQLGTVDAAVYTVAPASYLTVATASICNITSGSVNVYISLVKAGGTIGDGTHRVLNSYPLAANDSFSLKDLIGDARLGPGDAIAGYASTAASIDLVVTGEVYS